MAAARLPMSHPHPSHCGKSPCLHQAQNKDWCPEILCHRLSSCHSLVQVSLCLHLASLVCVPTTLVRCFIAMPRFALGAHIWNPRGCRHMAERTQEGTWWACVTKPERQSLFSLYYNILGLWRTRHPFKLTKHLSNLSWTQKRVPSP